MSEHTLRDTNDPRFWSKIEKDADSGCWVWSAAVDRTGYGRFLVKVRNCLAHRVSYETFVGKVPDGLCLDHLCRNRRCVNPEHLEPVTPYVNNLRGEAPSMLIHRSGRCSKGHLFTTDNLYFSTVRGKTRRACKACQQERARNQWATYREARNAQRRAGYKLRKGPASQ